MATKEIGMKFVDFQKYSSAWLWMEGGLLIMHSSPHICIIKWHFFCRRQIRKTISQSDTGVSIYFLIFFFLRMQPFVWSLPSAGKTTLVAHSCWTLPGTREKEPVAWQPDSFWLSRGNPPTTHKGGGWCVSPSLYIRQKRRRLCNLAETLN